jgi:hypothetical protein
MDDSDDIRQWFVGTPKADLTTRYGLDAQGKPLAVRGERIEAPWTPEQVDALNAWQRGPVHSFTCGRRSEPGHVQRPDADLGQLVATADGWVCPDGCGYTQQWAWQSMLQPPAQPPRLES